MSRVRSGLELWAFGGIAAEVRRMLWLSTNGITHTHHPSTTARALFLDV